MVNDFSNQQQARCYSYSLSVFCPHPMYPLLLGFLHQAYTTFASCTRSFLSRYLRHLQAPIYILALLLNHMHIFYQSLYKFSIPRINPYLHTNLLRHPFSPQSYVIQHMSTCVAVHCIAWGRGNAADIVFNCIFSQSSVINNFFWANRLVCCRIYICNILSWVPIFVSFSWRLEDHLHSGVGDQIRCGGTVYVLSSYFSFTPRAVIIEV